MSLSVHSFKWVQDTSDPFRGSKGAPQSLTTRRTNTQDTVGFGKTARNLHVRSMPSNIKSLHLAQGALNDCQLLSVLFALSRNRTGTRLLSRMIHPQKNGDFLIEFKPYPHLKIPVRAAEIRDQRKMMEGFQPKQVRGSLEARILEVAYARLMKTLHPLKYRKIPDHKVLDVYNSKEYHYSSSKVIGDFTGWQIEPVRIANTETALKAFERYADNPDRYVMTTFTKQPVTENKFLDLGDKIRGTHGFAVETIDLPNQQISLRDPHNTDVGIHMDFKLFFKHFLLPKPPATDSQGRRRSIRRGKGMVSRTWCRPQIQATVRSIPSPKPECGKLPYLRKSRYHSNASIGKPCA